MAKRSAAEKGTDEPEALPAQLLEVSSGRQAVTRVERDLCGDAVAQEPAVAEGLALAGVRAASFSDEVGSATVAGVALPGTSCVHHVDDAPGSERGAFELAAGSPQEAVDHCLAAHLLSRRLERAGLCSLDPALAERVTLLELPGPTLRDALLGAKPQAAEPGAAPERVVELAEQALHAVSERTARPAHVIRYAGDEPAEVVLVASGARGVQIDDLARRLSTGGLHAGALTLTLVLTR